MKWACKEEEILVHTKHFQAQSSGTDGTHDPRQLAGTSQHSRQK